MNKVEVDDQAQVQTQAATALPGFMRLETGSLVTIRMRGHTHSPGGLEYFAPAVVLAQYNDDYGSVDCLVWDSSAGNAYVHGYHVRELGVRGEGSERGMYELQSNIGQVLFSPNEFATMIGSLQDFELRLMRLEVSVTKLINAHVQSATEDKSRDAKRPEKSSSGA